MLVIVGAVVVIGATLGGFLMAGGSLAVLIQPSEFVVIGGAALGSMLISTPMAVLKGIGAQLGGAMGAGLTKADYVELLSLQYQVFKQVQQGGAMSLETHFDEPAKSSILSKYPKFLKWHEALDFLADSVKVIIVGGIAPHDLEALLDEDLKAHHDEALKPSAALAKIGDALPGLGIVAAVLGIVITMGHIDAPPAEIGHHVGAALVGTFLGILLSYGFLQPLAGTLEAKVNADSAYFICIKAGLLATYKGNPPAIAIEFARRVLPHEVRPSFTDTEKFCKAAASGGAGGGASMPAAA
ncbi:MAG: flagellar motor stator protein MotA [Vicinamibacterales bacterium]